MVIMTKGNDWSYSRIVELSKQFEGPEEDKSRRAKRRRIVAAATELIAQHGYRKVSVEEIAHRAQVAKGTVYLYYKNKAELLVHAIAAEKKRYLIRLKPVLDGSMAPRARLKEWIRLTLVLVKEMPLLSKLLEGDREVLMVIEEMDAGLRDDMIEMRQEFFRQMIRAAGPPDGFTEQEEIDRARLLSTLLYSGGAFFDDRIRHGLSIERFAELLADVVVDGVVNHPTGEETVPARESA